MSQELQLPIHWRPEREYNAWRINRIPSLEAALLSQDPNPQSLIPKLASLGLHGPRPERRHLNEAADLLLRHQRKGLLWDPAAFSKEAGFVFSVEQIERRAQKPIRQNPALLRPLAFPSGRAVHPRCGPAGAPHVILRAC